jgi:drug/metabolite transporter (DMT)-like permease
MSVVKPGNARAYPMLLLPPLLWSSLIVTGRAVIGEVPPASLTFWTWFVAGLAMLPLSLRTVMSRRRAIAAEFFTLLGFAVLGVAAFQGLYYAGLERTSAVNAALLSPTLPVLIACVAWLFADERLAPVQFAGAILALAGAAWISVGGEWRLLFALELGIGEMLILAANLCISGYTVMLRKTPSTLPPLAFMTVIALLGSAVLLPFYVVEALVDPRPALPLAHGVAILYIGIVTYDLAYVVWNISVARHGANTTGFFMYLIPVFGTLLAVLFLKEAVAAHHGAGMALIFAGILLCLHVPAVRVGEQQARPGPPVPTDKADR